MDTELDMSKYGGSSSRTKIRTAGSLTSGWNKEASSTATVMSELDSKRLARERLERYADEAGDTRYPGKLTYDPALETKTKRLRESSISQTLVNIKRSMEVDLCFVLDCTGSMASHIFAAK